MEDEKRGKDERILIWVLCGLISVVVILVVIIAVVKIKSSIKPDEEPPVSEIVEECFYDDEVEATVCETNEKALEEQKISEKVRSVEDEVAKMLKKTPVDVEGINQLYDGAISEALQLGRRDYALLLIDGRNEAFLSKGMEKELLEAFGTVDFSVYTEPDQYRLYTSAIDVAEKLGDTTALAKYQAMREKVKDAYVEDCKKTAAAVEKDKMTDGDGYEVKSVECE